MISRWNDQEAKPFTQDPLALRAYTSQLLGREPSLVQHGGGNTSVKIKKTNLFGEDEHILYVKGSGWDLATIKPQGFAPVKMDVLLKLARLETLSDTDMVREQKVAMTDPGAPGPSVETILHAIIPFQYVDHTHSDAVVTLTNTPGGADLCRQLYGSKVLFVPYVMPGFVLARRIFELTRDLKWDECEGIILLNHGVFTFANDARESYEKMIRLVSKAEEHLQKASALNAVKTSAPVHRPSTLDLAHIRRIAGETLGKPMFMRFKQDPESVGFSQILEVKKLVQKGTVTPDHVIHIKPWPIVLSEASTTDSIAADFKNFSAEYRAYFERNHQKHHQCLDTAPRWGVWPGRGRLCFATSTKSLGIVDDITRHSQRAMQWGQALGGWQPVSEKDLFEVEYWELEQAKLKVIKSGGASLEGKVALVTGAASGIGRACVQELKTQGAAVIALDINPKVRELFLDANTLGLECDVTNQQAVLSALQQGVELFGGLDIVVSNAGSFPPGKNIEGIQEQDWLRSMELNLNSHWRLLKDTIPLLKLGFDPRLVIIASRNVLAPGPGAAAYSAAKAGLTQLARVAALELAPYNVKVNILHPDAVFDTGIWTEDVLKGRAQHYGMSVDEYKRRNLLKTEVASADVARLAAAMCGPLFAKTTGSQVPIDGGNERVI